MNHLHQFITQNLLTQKNLIIKILWLVSTKGNKSVDPFDYLNQYSCKVKMALIIESIFISKTVVSLHIKVHEVYVKLLKPRRAIKESIVILSQVNIIHIRFFIVLFHLLPTLDFSSFPSQCDITWYLYSQELFEMIANKLRAFIGPNHFRFSFTCFKYLTKGFTNTFSLFVFQRFNPTIFTENIDNRQ